MRIATTMVVLGLAVVTATGSADAPTAAGRVATDDGLAARVDAVATRALDELPVAGMSIAVARAGEVVFADGYGLADVGARRAAAADTVHPVGSVSKQFTAAVLVGLEADGSLSLGDHVSRFVTLPAATPAPTVRQLLSHTAGFTDAALGPALEATSDGIGMTWDEAVDLATAPGVREPGAVFEYANGGYLVAHGVAEAASGLSHPDLVERLVAEVGLDDTHVCTGPDDPDVAAGHVHQHDAWARVARLGRAPGLRPAPGYDPDLLDVVCATAPDLVTWAHRLREGEVVGDDGYRRMSDTTTLTDGTVVPYGLGLQHRRFGDHTAVAHGGILTGHVAMLADFPDDDITVALLVATDLDERQAETLLLALLGAVFDEPPEQGWRADPIHRSPEEDR